MRSLFVASAGGHLEELRILADRLPSGPREVTWVTWETPQSRALLAGERHVFIDPAPPRSIVGTVRTARSARWILRGEPFEEVVSTGSVPAVPFMALARRRGIRCHYIESAARLTGPSLAGRLVAAIPGVNCYRQYPEWDVGSRFAYLGSVFDAFEPGARHPRPIERAVVTVGSSRFAFGRLVAQARAVLPADCEVLWQTGPVEGEDLGISSVAMVSPEELRLAVESADVVLAHAGVGTALVALAAGRCPVLLPREVARGEHVDDHQRLLARHLAARGLAVSPPDGVLTRGLLEEAAARTVRSIGDGVPVVEARSWAS